jgi:hypothetical protein
MRTALVAGVCLFLCVGCPGNDGTGAAAGSGAGSNGDAGGGSGGAYSGSNDDAGKGGTGGNAKGGSGASSGSGGAGGSGTVSSADPSDISDVPVTACPETPTSYTACGGDVTGTWVFVGESGDSPDCWGIDDEQEYYREGWNCPTTEVAGEYEERRWISFKADGRFTAAFHQFTDYTVSLPKSCLAEGSTCSAAFSSDDDASDGATTTVTDSADQCTVKVWTDNTTEFAGTWTASANKILATPEGETSDEDEAVEYCVSGSKLVLRSVEEGFVEYQHYERL